ncbi:MULTISPECIES: alpha/beta hydrolase [unclassified Leeuwenhoekiella]|uniref:alpha/beta hydrolase n=1 Tax=unclassified Leeuwenhoekiella TaxID=2615029 RepID=UPI000C65E022|nr:MULTISPECIES: alpha/beta hydrolase [unclassified Leeuwenhoekiella]MAW94400.1 esterase [Leeuwenhoekiella sp.]MBA81077.1 esterase [Leeuwenhoekiella sp.]|tara:strand:+ start:3337 stop:4167 length:831 start_codon:yes stop_codon:yes gene_type:complete
MRYNLFLSVLLMILITGCASVKQEDINYIKGDYTASAEKPKLNIFKPKDSLNPHDVLIFVHGGNWNSGNKETYSVLGRNFARKDYVTVVPGYTLSPYVNYDGMTQEIAEAIKWTHENIAQYGGKPDRIFVMGHSAGGHLVALATMSPNYLNNPDYIKGIILNDAAGLDMYEYLQENPPTSEDYYDVTWTKNPEEWKKASPFYYLDEKTPPILMFLGTKTYPSLYYYNDLFYQKLKEYQPEAELIILNKNHTSMVTQFFSPISSRFGEIQEFTEGVD